MPLPGRTRVVADCVGSVDYCGTLRWKGEKHRAIDMFRVV